MFTYSQLTYIQIPSGDVIRADTITGLRIIKGSIIDKSWNEESGFTLVIERDRMMCGLDSINIPYQTCSEAQNMRNDIFNCLGKLKDK